MVLATAFFVVVSVRYNRYQPDCKDTPGPIEVQVQGPKIRFQPFKRAPENWKRENREYLASPSKATRGSVETIAQGPIYFASSGYELVVS